jgi:hypothetical protein
MRFLYSDSLDYVDPEYDFLEDRGAERRRAHEDDDFPHEHLSKSPYDGILVSRAIVGNVQRSGKYTEAQRMRFVREGARAFLRYPADRYPGSIVMGDCGAFSYRNERDPPYSVDDTLEFYEDAGFTHGCSVDHLIFDFINDELPPSEEARRRSELTMANAEHFLRGARQLGQGFTPLGVIQGWSAASMAEAAEDLSKMGYDYLAVGGMAALAIDQIERALQAIRIAIPPTVKLHLLGFGKTEHLERVRDYGVASFDTTSPLIRAFKDAVRNYYAISLNGELGYYTAIRIPQAIQNDKLLRRAKRGRLDQESLLRLETNALATVRAYADHKGSLEPALDAVIAYDRYALWDESADEMQNESALLQLRSRYARTLDDRPWERCDCRVCREGGVEALIFRSSNRNKRRGIHNLQVFYSYLQASRLAEVI